MIAIPDHGSLFEIASEQLGYFTAAQARSAGFDPSILSHHARTGRFKRVRRGLYRLRDYPSSSHEEVMAAWLAVGKQSALVSHDSALDLLELTDVIPASIHLTVPRSRRNLPTLPGVTIHTSSRPIRPTDVTTREGIRLTGATRTILDLAEIGLSPEHVELAIGRAVRRGLVTQRLLSAAAQDRSWRVRQVIDAALTLTRQ